MYSLLFIFPLVLYFLLSKKKNAGKAKRQYVIVMTIVLSAVSGLRGVGTGVDTYDYYMSFESIKQTSWVELGNNVLDLFHGNFVLDPGYFLFVKVVQIFTSSFYVYNFIVALIVTSAIGMLIYRGVDKIIGYLLGYSYYISLLYWNVPNNIARQSITIAIMIFAMLFVLKKKLLPAVAFMFVGVLFHKSAVIGIIPLLLLYVKDVKWIYFSAIILTPIIFIVGQDFVNLLVIASDSERYLKYMNSETSARPIVYMLQMFIFFIMGIGMWRKKYPMNDIQRVSFSCFALSMVFVSMLWVNSDLIRIGMYFSIFGVVYLPYCISRFKGSRWIIYLAIMSLLIGRSIMQPQKYQFFWEKVELHDRYL